MSNQTSMVKIAINKSILKEYKNSDSLYERIVYLDNGSEFQIQIFNPHNFVVGAKIYINSTPMSYMLVLKPGERIWLERYLDKSVKFRFETYEVDADEETKKAIQNNGEVKVVFYKEEQKSNAWEPLIYYDYDYFNSKPYTYTFDNPTSITTNVELNALYGESAANTGLCTFSCGGINTSTNYSIDTNLTSSTKPLKTTNPDKIETGRIEEGGYSGQQFKNVYRNFESWSFSTETIKLLPVSQKQYNATDLKKHYCTHCGRKINMKYKYCPYCGNKIE